MSEPEMIILDRRRRGRPRAEVKGSKLSTWVPVSEHDRLIKEAKARDVSLSEWVRIKLTSSARPA
jgi:predicted HicB family RNase H-like nuclease